MKTASQGHFVLRKLVFAVSGESYLIGRVHRNGHQSPKLSITLRSNEVTHHETITTHAGFRINAFVTQAFEHRTFFTRLHQFVLASDAFIVAPGGIGTVLETMMIWQLLQVRHLENTPLILVGKMWPGLIDWASSSMLSFDPSLANPDDIDDPALCGECRRGDRYYPRASWQLAKRAKALTGDLFTTVVPAETLIPD